MTPKPLTKTQPKSKAAILQLYDSYIQAAYTAYATYKAYTAYAAYTAHTAYAAYAAYTAPAKSREHTKMLIFHWFLKHYLNQSETRNLQTL